MLKGIALGHAVVCEEIAGADLVAAVAIQRRFCVRVLKQIYDGAAQRLESPHRRVVLWLQDIETNLARLPVYIWMEALRDHLDLWWIDWVILADVEVQLEPAVLIRTVRRPLDERLPPVQMVVVRGCKQHELVFTAHGVEKLLVQTIARHDYKYI